MMVPEGQLRFPHREPIGQGSRSTVYEAEMATEEDATDRLKYKAKIALLSQLFLQALASA